MNPTTMPSVTGKHVKPPPLMGGDLAGGDDQECRTETCTDGCMCVEEAGDVTAGRGDDPCGPSAVHRSVGMASMMTRSQGEAPQ